ncbi:hexokinase [Cryptosporidium canis]|uniref:Phosphotransferase n=1 Tax=Cryptosporidium canis TaxID=195482 RepID=A0ABQ8P4X5_9CRYT|nr:hexokinase [Cryptosporidium canis]
MEEDRLENGLFDLYEEYFFLSKSRKLELVDDFYKSLESGLENHKDPMSKKHHYDYRPFKMLDSCIEKLPTGKESGVYYAIDMGGTNLRCVRVNLLGNGQSETKIKKVKLSEMKVFGGSETSESKQDVCILHESVTSEEMFNSIAIFFNEFLNECDDLGDICPSQPLKVAFTFSFPTEQLQVDSANLITWTKGIETGRSTNDPVEGRDVGQLLNSAFKRNGITARCKCVINDTVGTLLSAMYDLNENTSVANIPNIESENKPLIGIVIGTGVNACYFEPKSPNYGYKGAIINTECGDFYSPNLPSTDCDLSIDWFSDNRGKQRFEKMVSGTYLGEISRCLIINFLKSRTPEIFFKKDSFKTEHIAEIVSQLNDKYHICDPNHTINNSPNIVSIEKYLKETFSSHFDHHSALIIARISQMVLTRAASLVSVLLAAFIRKINKSHNQAIIAIDGSVWTKIPAFQKYVKDSLSSLTPENATLHSVHFYESDDGSGRGAAILASITQQAS